MTITEMRKTANRELMAYCRNKERLVEFEERGLRIREVLSNGTGDRQADPTAYATTNNVEPPHHIKQIRGWVWSIEQAQAILRGESPEQARLMIRLYGLDGGFPAVRMRNWRPRLVEEMNVSEPTLYRWREDILQAGIVGAVQAGVMKAYG